MHTASLIKLIALKVGRPKVMKCHYELLEVARDADDEVIKKAYRKMALKWHPDKNPDRIEECTQYFALLQQAYDVLSDPHERSFYDKHRESILKGGFDGENYKDSSLDLFQFFTSTCYSGFDGPKGFYAVYKNVFETLGHEDYDFIDDPSVQYPSFGDADSDYDMVTGRFYGFWSAFCTARSFAWLEQYDIREAENRFQARLIEAENKKMRDAGKAERNDQIRELVAFIRKRDPRVKAYREELELRQLEAKKKQEENRRKQLERNKEMYGKDESMEAANRQHFEQLLAEHDDNTCSEEENEDGDPLPFCVVCNKSFKTANAMVNHEKSKQHKKQLAELMKHMKEEDVAIFEEASAAAEVETPEKKGKKAKRRAKKKKAWDDPDSDAEDSNVAELTQQVEEVSLNEEAAPEEEQRRVEEAVEGETEEKPLSGEKKQKEKKKAQENGVVEEMAPPKTGKCDKCGEFFESRTRLFEHLRETGHATLKSVPTPAKNKKGKRK